MSIAHVLSRCFWSAVAAGLVLAAAPARSAVIASFDPAFGPAIPNLGFRGTITLDVTAGCYTLGPGFQATGGTCRITVQSAQIDYYNAASNPNNVLTRVALGSSAFATNYVYGAYFDPLTGQLAGLDTIDSALFNVAVTDPRPPIAYNGVMVLFFQTGFAPLGDLGTNALATVPGVGAAYLRNCTGVSRGGVCESDPFNTSNPARLTFTTVPEPGGSALALLGLGALLVTRRRALPPASQSMR